MRSRVQPRRVGARLLLLVWVGFVACATNEPVAGPTAAERVEALVERLPSEICGGRLFAECLGLSEAACEAAVTPIVAQCGQEELRDVTQRVATESKSSGSLGEQITACAAQGLMVTQLPHLSIASECLSLYR